MPITESEVAAALALIVQSRPAKVREIAHAAGMTANTLSRIMGGTRSPSLGGLLRLLDATETDFRGLQNALDSNAGRRRPGVEERLSDLETRVARLESRT
ncbi:MAG: helix-turn-helix transcriptional regulator [Holophagales bacterium]|nr:helix-turn-helix transcriptional regulator [Holophagales bacterium]